MRCEKMPKGDDCRKATVGSAGYQRIWYEDCRHKLIISAQKIIDKGRASGNAVLDADAAAKMQRLCSTKVGIMADGYDRARDHPRR